MSKIQVSRGCVRKGELASLCWAVPNMKLTFIAGITRLTHTSFVAALLSTIAAHSAMAAPFINGSFESPGGANEVSLDTNPTYITGWTANGTGMFYEGPGNSHGWTAHTGSYGVSFGHDSTAGTLSQTFDTNPGRIYTVTYFVSRIQGGTSFQVITAEAIDAASGTSLEVVGVAVPAANNTWIQGQTLTFTAASASTELRFKGQHFPSQPDDSNCALDSVRVVEAPPVAVSALHAFSEHGAAPVAPLLRASDGSFYGTTQYGGFDGHGTIFRVTQTASGFETTTIHNFRGATDGARPYAGLIQGSDGSFYGTATEGGTAGAGTAFRLAPNADGSGFTFTTIHHFAANTSFPRARLLQTSDGSFYGTTQGGGTNQAGTVYKLTPDGNGGFAFSVLHSFHPSTTGQSPLAGLIQGSDGNLYGTTLDGGPRDQFGNGGWGTVYKMVPDGSSVTVLRSFRYEEGRQLWGELVQGTDGDFYGMAHAGGPEDAGSVFKVSATGVFTLLHTFTYATKENGLLPKGALVQGPDGTFYGTTTQGGVSTPNAQYGHGTVFKMTVSGSTGTVTTLHRFDNSASQGRDPEAGVVLGDDGFLYGTTAGGALGRGTAFRVSTGGSDYQTVTRFAALGGNTPRELTLGRDGNFYGTTAAGGAEDKGTVFKLTPAGVKTVLHSFNGPDGANPRAALVQGRDGNLYGTTEFGGGVDDAGTLFRITPNADGSFSFAVLYTFNYTEGGYVAAALLEDRERAGEFYGLGQYGGTSANGSGILFKVNVNGPSAVLTVLHNFDGDDGAYPSGDLVQAADGTLFGTATYGNGGRSDNGTIWRAAPDGSAFTVLHTFTGPDGGYVTAGLRQVADGIFYGTTGAGGTSNGGTVFKFTRNADGNTYTLTTLHNFGQSDGYEPRGTLLQASDGDLYGTTYQGGAATGSSGQFQIGTIFKVAVADGSFAKLYSFEDGVNGRNPSGALVAGPDGNLYGTAERGGANGGGTVFRLVVQPVITSTLAASNQVGGSFSYQITAARAATSYSASGLPLGLSINTSTGAITGTPQCSGTYSVQISAANAAGTDTKTLTLTVAPPPAPTLTAPAEGARTNAAPVLTGTTQPGSAIRLTITGGISPVVVTTTADSNGNFSVSSPELAEGAYSVSAVVRFCNDGESSVPSNTRSFTIDTTPPVITASDVVVYNQNRDGANVSFDVTAIDGIDGQVTVATDRASGSFFPIGTTTVTATARDTAGNTATKTFRVTVRATEMANISTRVPVGSRDNEAGIGGFIVQGNGLRRIVVRALGPSLNANGAAVPNRLENPTLQLFRGGSDEPIATNDDWETSSNASSISAVGLAPNDSRESAILIDLAEGEYTAVIRGAGGSAGNALVEVYAVLTDAPAFLGNISTRGFVQTGDNVLIGGVIVRGGDPQRLLFRAIGPDLANRGVSDALQDPVLELFDSNGESLALNDNWRDNEEAISETKMPPSDDRESAIVQTLRAGNYTAVVRGVADTTGIGLVEVFTIPAASSAP